MLAPGFKGPKKLTKNYNNASFLNVLLEIEIFLILLDEHLSSSDNLLHT